MEHVSGADRLTKEGNPIKSALDHIYFSQELSKHTNTRKSDESSTGQVLIYAGIENSNKQRKKVKIIIKRCMRDFMTERLKDSLAGKEWERLAETEDVEKMEEEFTDLMKTAKKNFKINTNYEHGLTKETKELIKERDDPRKK